MTPPAAESVSMESRRPPSPGGGDHGQEGVEGLHMKKTGEDAHYQGVFMCFLGIYYDITIPIGLRATPKFLIHQA